MSSPSLVVLSRASDQAQAIGLERTGAKNFVPFVWLAGSYSNTDLGEAFTEGIQAIESVGADCVVVTDAFDVLVSRWDPDEIIRKILDAPGNLIMSCEADCWPAGAWCQSYRAWESPTPWYAICAGQYTGTSSAVIRAMREIQARAGTVAAGGSSQELLHRMYADGFPMALDRRCEIFQSMSGYPAKAVEAREGKAFNTLTGAWPMFMHWNGRAPGMDGWMRALGC